VSLRDEEEEEEEETERSKDEHPLVMNSPAVEIDESLFTHLVPDANCPENSVYARQCWILGIYDRATKDVRMIALGSDRSIATIQPLVRKYVHTQAANPTRVYTDKALFYSFLNEDGYRHFQLNHTRGFGKGVWTTNHIESMWSQLKRIGRFDSGLSFVTIAEVQCYLNEVVWRWRNKHDCLVTQLALILSLRNPEEDSLELEYEDEEEDD